MLAPLQELHRDERTIQSATSIASLGAVPYAHRGSRLQAQGYLRRQRPRTGSMVTRARVRSARDDVTCSWTERTVIVGIETTNA